MNGMKLIRNFHMKPIDKHNWRAITSLKVHSEQEECIESNAESITEFLFEKQFAWSCFGLYLDNQVVSFTMIGAYNESEERSG